MSDKDFSYSIQPIKIEEELWKLKANCLGLDTEMFFPEAGFNVDLMIKAICNNCEVKKECLDYAIKYDMEGFWAGTGQKKRRQLRQKSTSHRG